MAAATALTSSPRSSNIGRANDSRGESIQALMAIGGLGLSNMVGLVTSNPVVGGAVGFFLGNMVVLSLNYPRIDQQISRRKPMRVLKEMGAAYKISPFLTVVGLFVCVAQGAFSPVSVTSDRLAREKRAREEAIFNSLPMLKDSDTVPAHFLNDNPCTDKPSRPVRITVGGQDYRYTCR